MHRIKEWSKWMRSFAGKRWRWTRSHVNFRRLLHKAESQRTQEIMPIAGVVAGALAFGLWWENLGAAIFGAIGLYFLAAIYRSTEKLLIAVRKSDKMQVSTADAGRVQPTLENGDDLNKAISTLKPWLANEAALTEEDAKQCCAVLVDTVVEKARAIEASDKLTRSIQLKTKFALDQRARDFQLAAGLPGSRNDSSQG